jgi:hypothetical protein
MNATLRDRIPKLVAPTCLLLTERRQPLQQDAEHRFLRASVSLWEAVIDHASWLMRGTAIGLWHWKEIHHSATEKLDEMKCRRQSRGSPTSLLANTLPIGRRFVLRRY